MRTSLISSPLLKAAALSLSFLCLASCGTVRMYSDPDQPISLSNAYADTTTQNETLRVVTFNIAKADKIEEASEELKALGENGIVGIFLLQEMDEAGVKIIAEKFGLNYLYIPIAHNNLYHKDVGNAILAKGRIERPEKFILPHSKWVNNRLRHVAIAEVVIHQQKILVYCVHTETVMMSRKKRMDQVDAILAHAGTEAPAYGQVLIGGDFNALFSKDADSVIAKFRSHGFDTPTAGSGGTAHAFFGLPKPRHDFIFSRGLKVVGVCNPGTSMASDHYPILAAFSCKGQRFTHQDGICQRRFIQTSGRIVNCGSKPGKNQLCQQIQYILLLSRLARH